jgi:hypothetical protein
VRTEISRRPKGEMFALFALAARVQMVKAWPFDPLCSGYVPARGAGKVTTGITGLWQPSVHSDVAF